MIPTATPYPAGSAVMFGDWQVKVEKVVVANQVTYLNSVYKPKGQFVLVFMTVVNRASRPQQWMGFDTIEIRDSSGQTYSENQDATFGALDTYNLKDWLNYTNPDASISVVVGFDLPVGKNSCVIVPARGSGQTGTTATLRLNVP